MLYTCFSSDEVAMYSKSSGGTIIMFGVTCGQSGRGRETQTVDHGARGAQSAPGTAPCAPWPSRSPCRGRGCARRRGKRVSKGMRRMAQQRMDAAAHPSFCTTANCDTSCAIAARIERFGRRPLQKVGETGEQSTRRQCTGLAGLCSLLDVVTEVVVLARQIRVCRTAPKAGRVSSKAALGNGIRACG